MVKRRSTVRLRKGAPRSGLFFDIDPVTSPWGIPAEGTGQRPGWKPEFSRDCGLRMVRAGRPGRRGVSWGHFGGARSLSSGFERRVRSPLACYFAGLQERDGTSNDGQRKQRQRAGERAHRRRFGGSLIQASPLTKRHQAHYLRDNTGAAQVVRLVERVKPGLHRQARRGSATKSPSSLLATATAQGSGIIPSTTTTPDRAA